MAQTPTYRGDIESVNNHTTNDFIRSGCEVEGHENQQLQFIFLKNKNDKGNLFGCSYCVAERQYEGAKVISLIQALKTRHRESIFRFPELNSKIQQDVLKAIQTTHQLKYDEEIDSIFYNLRTRLNEEIDTVESLAEQLIKDIRGKGDDMQDTYKSITNCDKLREIFETADGYDQLHSELDTIIRDIYAKTAQNNDEIKQKTQQYVDKLKTFTMEYSEKLSKKILEAIKKISFEKQDNVKMVQNQPPTVQKEQYLKRESSDNSYKEESFQLEQKELSGKLKNVYLPFQIIENRSGLQTFVNECEKGKKFLNQTFSKVLDKQMTYKIHLRVKNYTPTSLFSVGLGNYAKNTEALVATTTICKVFNPTKDYEGLTFVEYGVDVSKCHGEDQDFIFKFNISKNYAKILSGDKQSSNTFVNNIQFDQSIDYCFYIINQTPSFQIEIVKVEVKNN
ncbi:hypothetical protein ABPG74_012662 [Tetrahymena malaccensis]